MSLLWMDNLRPSQPDVSLPYHTYRSSVVNDTNIEV